MNYYPTNFYSNYPYNQQYQPVTQPQQQMMQPQQMQPQISQMSLQGKIVDSEDMVRVTDVPVGGYGIFPRADLNEIYVKTWNNNGTTSILTYKPVIKDTPKQIDTDLEEKNIIINNDALLDKIEQLEEKIDNFISSNKPVANQSNQNTKRKEF